MILTDKFIATIKPGATWTRNYHAGTIPGLSYCVHPSGAASWALRYRRGGKSRQVTIGKSPGLDVEAARMIAADMYARVCAGRDPGDERKAERQAAVVAAAPIKDHVERVAAQYLKHAKARTRESTFRETKRVFTVEILPAWRGRRLSEISKQDVRKLIEGVAKRAPIGANRLLASVKAFFNWAISVDVITGASPAAAIRPPAPEVARARTLTDDELGAVLEACAGLGEYGLGVKLLAITGQRRAEVFGMTWQEIDMAAKIWTLPSHRAKNGHEHQIPLSPQALAILESLKSPKLVVFEPVGFSQAKARLEAELKAGARIKLPPWTLHDLRRTAASGMAALGVAPHIIEAVLNHRSGVIRGVASVYNRYSYASEKRSALDLWGAHVAALSPSPASLSKAA